MENANKSAANDNGTGDQEIFCSNADDVSSIPDRPLPIKDSGGSVVTSTKPVIVQITTVSMKGSSSATNPSVSGVSVFTAE